METRIRHLVAEIARLRAEVGRAFFGHEELVEKLVIALVAGGHCLIEGVPGLGKTVLVKTLSRALDLRFSRIQFTPDLMPADVLGTNILLQEPDGRMSFKFERGPIFGNIVLADEINRATPKTQSALLEAMQESAVTISGVRHELAPPFVVIATQNPIEMEGTYPLPEAQLDRFFFKLIVQSPSVDELVRILDGTTGPTTSEVRAVLGAPELLELRELVRQVPVSKAEKTFVAQIVRGTDPTNPEAPADVRRYLRYGASPRGAQSVLLAGKARALLAGRLAVTREDLEVSIVPALRHRVLLNFEAEADGIAVERLLAEVAAWARRKGA
ncbi:MAG: AAA family ATPase [Planctomycetes bacterium]|nr:AAA family ATPase [Planctomycetota bacterium]